jgi:uncharacterized membrane protein YeaQ/YmgE (transglycosylase-associated protein family)
MSFILMIVAGLIPSVIAKLLRPTDQIGRLFILGITGSFLAAAMLYSEHQPITFVVPSIGAVIMLVLYAVTPHRTVVPLRRMSDGNGDVGEEGRHDDFRKAA